MRCELKNYLNTWVNLSCRPFFFFNPCAHNDITKPTGPTCGIRALSLSLSLSLHLCAEESEARCNYPGELQVSCYHTDSNQWTNSPVNSNATSLYVTAVGITVVTTPLVDEMHLCAATFICPHDRRKTKSQEDWSGSKLSFPFVEKHKGLIHLLFLWQSYTWHINCFSTKQTHTKIMRYLTDH